MTDNITFPQFHWRENQLIGHLIILKQPKCFPKASAPHHSMNKLALNDPAISVHLMQTLNYLISLIYWLRPRLSTNESHSCVGLNINLNWILYSM